MTTPRPFRKKALLDSTTKVLVYIFLLASLCSCGSDENDSIVDCRIIGGEVVFDANGNYVGCVEPTNSN